jgi:toxin ParE1/3/4
VGQPWDIALTARAEADIQEISAWTEEKFGPDQAETYAAIINVTILELKDGPNPVGARPLDDILPGLKLVHVARHGHHGRHFVVFRAMRDRDRTIVVLRILHDQMDIVRHLPTP